MKDLDRGSGAIARNFSVGVKGRKKKNANKKMGSRNKHIMIPKKEGGNPIPRRSSKFGEG